MTPTEIEAKLAAILLKTDNDPAGRFGEMCFRSALEHTPDSHVPVLLRSDKEELAAALLLMPARLVMRLVVAMSPRVQALFLEEMAEVRVLVSSGKRTLSDCRKAQDRLLEGWGRAR